MRHLSFIFAAFAVILSASAYDTGHHSDLTRNAMEIFGYNTNAQLVGATSNWFIDYYSYTVEFKDIPQLTSLHFDNLYHLPNISNYINRLVRNTRATLQQAVNDNDRITYLSIIGATLHAVQDFYTHSTWTESHQIQCGCYRDDTFFSELSTSNGNLTDMIFRLQNIRTYSWDGLTEWDPNILPGQIPHGDYCEGINKDSYVRPWFEKSYGHAFAASIEWIYNLEKWVLEFNPNSTLINDARNYTDTQDNLDALEKNYESSIEVSYATKLPFGGEDDGHYKGSGSGSVKRFATTGAEFLKASTIYKDQFEQKKFWQTLVSPKLYDTDPADNIYAPDSLNFITPYSQLPENLRNFRKVKLRTTRVRVGRGDPYAILQFGGLEIEEAVQIDTKDFKPHWTTIKFVPVATQTIDVVYQLWDDEYPGSDKPYNIVNDADGKLSFTFDLTSGRLTGEIVGNYNDANSTYLTVDGDVTVEFYIRTENYGSCVWDGTIEPFCPNEAYTELRTHSICGDDAAQELQGSAVALGVSVLAVIATILLIL